MFAIVDKHDGRPRKACVLLHNLSSIAQPNGIAYDRSSGSLYIAGVSATNVVGGCELNGRVLVPARPGQARPAGQDLAGACCPSSLRTSPLSLSPAALRWPHSNQSWAPLLFCDCRWTL